MSEPLNLKQEIAKSTISETVKALVRLALLLISVLAVALYPPLRDRIWPLIPKWFLAVLLVICLSVILSLVPYLLHLRRKLRDDKASSDAEIEGVRTALLADMGTVKTELETIKAKPNYPYKFGLKWDEEFNPRCPHCQAHLSSFQFVQLSQGNALSRVLCAGCGRIIFLTDERGLSIRFADARKRIIAEAVGRGEIAP